MNYLTFVNVSMVNSFRLNLKLLLERTSARRKWTPRPTFPNKRPRFEALANQHLHCRRKRAMVCPSRATNSSRLFLPIDRHWWGWGASSSAWTASSNRCESCSNKERRATFLRQNCVVKIVSFRWSLNARCRLQLNLLPKACSSEW